MVARATYPIECHTYIAHFWSNTFCSLSAVFINTESSRLGNKRGNNYTCVSPLSGAVGSWPRPVFCLLLGISSGCARPVTGQATSVIWPLISWPYLFSNLGHNQLWLFHYFLTKLHIKNDISILEQIISKDYLLFIWISHTPCKHEYKLCLHHN